MLKSVQKKIFRPRPCRQDTFWVFFLILVLNDSILLKIGCIESVLFSRRGRHVIRRGGGCEQ